MTGRKKITVPDLIEMKRLGKKIVALTAYDYTLGAILDDAGIDLILVGDSCAMVVSGYESTIPITLDEMIYHTASVNRGVKYAVLAADMPFLSFQVNPDQAVQNAGRFFKEGGVEAVKVEGGEEIAETVRRIVDAGMPVMGHLGLTPQSIRKFGGYKLQGSTKKSANKMVNDAVALEQAGVFSIVLEKIPSSVAKSITNAVKIPTIGIGAGVYCDGQILVTHDILGLFEKFKPKFARRYAELGKIIREACIQYAADIRSEKFPNQNESYNSLKDDPIN